MTLVPSDVAAVAVGRERGTIISWSHRGLITPAGRVGRRPVFDLDEVFEVDAAIRDRSRGHGGLRDRTASASTTREVAVG